MFILLCSCFKTALIIVIIEKTLPNLPFYDPPYYSMNLAQKREVNGQTVIE